MSENKLIFGDNLEAMREIESNSVDIICTDPPFNSGSNWNIYLPGEAQEKAFTDIWQWNDFSDKTRADMQKQARTNETYKVGLDTLKGFDQILGAKHKGNKGSTCAYLTFMAPRIIEMHRLLKKTGSIYLHCDPTASHYLKVFMDAIFDQANKKENDFFKNEIIWGYRTGGVSKKHWPRKHDTLLFYTKSKAYQHNPLQERIYYEKPFFVSNQDEQGRYYADVFVRDVWEDIKPLINVSKERLGYPTQKPRELYERMIKTSSNEGDLVLDPFAGCGTTIDAAQTLGRRWIGIDLTMFAFDPMQKRLREVHGLKSHADYEIEGYPTNMQELKLLLDHDKRRHDIANYLVTRLGLYPTQDVGDGGYDGAAPFTTWIPEGMKENEGKVIAEVKTGKVKLTDVRAFRGVMHEQNAVAGVFITLGNVTNGMRETASKMGTYQHNGIDYPKFQFWQVTDEYFKNPDSINQQVRLPKTIMPTKKSERHIPDSDQMKMDVAAG